MDSLIGYQFTNIRGFFIFTSINVAIPDGMRTNSDVPSSNKYENTMV